MARMELLVLLNGERMGLLMQDARGRLSFSYTLEWLARAAPVPLSLSMPVLPTNYTGDAVENWLWGLLPDNEETLRRWAQEFQVSARNVFALLTELGEDVAGAVQFVRPERERDALEGGHVRWLSDDEMNARIRLLAEDAAAARRTDDPGRFSLAGAQAKAAFLFRDGRWGVPGGHIPTNCIVKPAATGFDGLVENEHFCLQLLAAAGLSTARTRVEAFDGVSAIVVERYDRALIGDELVRVHQEDFCQARGMHPMLRYENEGGPGVLNMFDTLHASSQPSVDRESFLRAQILNFLIGGTDAHAKNFSILLGERGAVRLAPLYDVASMLPYADSRRMKLAMKIGSRYEFESTLPRHWAGLGRKLRDLPSPVEILDEYSRSLPALAEKVAENCRNEGLRHPVIGRLVDAIARSCEESRQQLAEFYKQA